MRINTLKAGAVVAIACATTGVAGAGLIIRGDIPASSEQTGSDYLAQLSYAYLGGHQGQLSVELTNTTPAGVGGFLTAFVFNFMSADPDASINLVSTSRPAFTDAGGASAAPFGSNYDAGAGLGGTFLGGGSPHGGIPVGGTETFAFSINASDASTLSLDAFAEGGYDYNFVVRFRGLADGGSDKVPGDLTRVPAPGSLALCGLAAGLIARRRRH